MNKGSLAPMLGWLRLPRDWYAVPGLGMACDDAGPAAAAGWPLLLVRALLKEGRFSDRNDVVSSLRCLDIGLTMQIAAEIADAYSRHGLVLPDGGGYVIADLDRYIPADNAIPHSARPLAQVLRSVSPEPRPEVTEGEREGSKEGFTEGGRESQLGSGGQGVHFFTDDNGVEYAVMPEKLKPTEAGCSHGHPWQLRPAGVSNAGVPYPAYWSGNHQLANGQWCKDRPRATS